MAPSEEELSSMESHNLVPAAIVNLNIKLGSYKIHILFSSSECEW
jgi:hypothetical protein